MITASWDKKLYKLVPVNQTNQMNEAHHDTPCGFGGSPPHPNHIWESVLAAVPEPSELHGVVVHSGEPYAYHYKETTEGIYGETWDRFSRKSPEQDDHVGDIHDVVKLFKKEREGMSDPSEQECPTDAAQDALNKMRRAHDRGTGCRLTADEIFSLSLTKIGEMWADSDPRITNNGEKA